MPRKTKIGTEAAHVTRDSDTTFKVKRSKVNLQGRGHIVAASRTACYYRATLCVSAVFAVARCLSVRPSVHHLITLMHCTQTAEDIVKLLSRLGSPISITLVFYPSADTQFQEEHLQASAGSQIHRENSAIFD